VEERGDGSEAAHRRRRGESLGFGRGGGRGGAVQARPEVRGFVVEWREGLLMVTRQLPRGSLLFSNKIRPSFFGLNKMLLDFISFLFYVLVSLMHSCSTCKMFFTCRKKY
jgi:hypothetical protein